MKYTNFLSTKNCMVFLIFASATGFSIFYEYTKIDSNDENIISSFNINNDIELITLDYLKANFPISSIITNDDINRSILDIKNSNKKNCKIGYIFNGKEVILRIDSNKIQPITTKQYDCADEIYKRIILLKKQKLNFLSKQLEIINKICFQKIRCEEKIKIQYETLKTILSEPQISYSYNKNQIINEKGYISIANIIKSIVTGTLFALIFFLLYSRFRKEIN
jgi:hypothetical protein